MKHFILTLTAALMSISAFASTEVCIDHKKKEITLTAHYYFYGLEATDTVAGNCVNEINRQFNNGHAIQLNKAGDWLKIKVNVTYSVLHESYVESIASNNYDPKYNFVRIDTPTKGSRVDVSEHGLSSNYGYFITKNGLGTSTTCTHEFAHGLGLVHIDPCDWRGKGTPPIMAARGCLVDPAYQYNPKVKAGQPGGTINPTKREVISKEFQKINMGDLNYKWVSQNVECANQGKASQRMYRRDGTFYNARSPLRPWEYQTYPGLSINTFKSDTISEKPFKKEVKASKEKIEDVKEEVEEEIREDIDELGEVFETIRN